MKKLEQLLTTWVSHVKATILRRYEETITTLLSVLMTQNNEISGRKLEAFEMCLCHRMLRVSSIQKMLTSFTEWGKTNKRKFKAVKARKLQYQYFSTPVSVSWEIRIDIAYFRIFSRKVLGRAGPCIRRISWFENLITWFSATNTRLFRELRSGCPRKHLPASQSISNCMKIMEYKWEQVYWPPSIFWVAVVHVSIFNSVWSELRVYLCIFNFPIKYVITNYVRIDSVETL